jgi:hypothetical protein
MDLVASVKLAQTAARFVEGGPLEEALAELDMTAAHAALLKAGDARDTRAQVWSAVNHLEGAQAAIDSKLRRRGSFIAAARVHRYEFLVDKLRYVEGLMAVCYRYLGEERLAQQALGRVRFPQLKMGPMVAGGLLSLVSPLGRWDEEISYGESKYDVDWEAFELPPRQ